MTQDEAALREKILKTLESSGLSIEDETTHQLSSILFNIFKTSNAEAYRQGQIKALTDIEYYFSETEVGKIITKYIAELNKGKD